MPYKKCFYKNCKNTSLEVSMFRFPVNDKERLNLWIRNAGNDLLNSLSNNELTNRHLCAAHFSKSSMHQGSQRCKLLGPAIPIPFQFNNIEDAVTNHNHHQKEKNIPPLQIYLMARVPTNSHVPEVQDPLSENTESSPSPTTQEPSVENSPEQDMPKKNLFIGPRSLCKKNLIKQDENDSPLTKCLKSTVLKLIKKNKALCAKIFRLRAKMNAMKNKDNCHILLKMQDRKMKQKKAWTEAEKEFCLSLYKKSSSAYEFLRRQGIKLAARTTIKMWLRQSSLPSLESHASPSLPTDLQM